MAAGAAAEGSASGAPVWAQSTVRLGAKKRGSHLVTAEIEKGCAANLARIDVGLAHLFLQHTSASISLNENCDPDVRLDLADHLDELVPDAKAGYRHTAEGPDDMSAHIKCSLVGASLSIPITRGAFNLGTWQGVYLNEHRDRASGRTIVVTLQGAAAKK